MFLAELAQKALKDEYFLGLLSRLESLNAKMFLGVKQETFDDTFTQKEYDDTLRFADLLSLSSDGNARNAAYKIISLLAEHKSLDEHFGIFSNAVLSKIGNFPGLQFLDKQIRINQQILPFERQTEKLIKAQIQRVPHDATKVFTDSQYKIFESLKASNHYSFSGPTSIGKSFVLQAFIRHLTLTGAKEAPNVVVLVPTRALINEVSEQLRKALKESGTHTVLSHPIIPEYFLRKHKGGYIFVLTPERMISYLAEKNGPKIDYLFVDEAQKIVSDNDERSPLYYHAILQAERKSIKLFFASPNIPNPEIFLKLFEKSQDESQAFTDSPVAQNRYFLDLVKGELLLFHQFEKKDEKILTSVNDKNIYNWIIRLGANSSIIYLNKPALAISFARKLAEQLPEIEDSDIKKLIKRIENRIHKQYYLIDCLKKGVAFHFGKLPQEIRLQVEELFRKKKIKYIFCTSTLLEGVNLPAKNIFIASNYVGPSKLSDIDFWNLAGRAGRLTEELSGNVICIRAPSEEYKSGLSWSNPDTDLELVKNTKVKGIKPAVLSKKSLYQNIQAALEGTRFTRKTPTETDKKIWKHYANIVLIHEISGDASILKTNLINQDQTIINTLHKKSEQNKVPERILSISSSIKAEYQNKILLMKEPLILGNEITYESVLNALGKMYRAYNWQEEESGGRYPLCESEKSLTYLATIANEWMSGKSLSEMIGSSISYHVKRGTIYISPKQPDEIFDSANREHLNIIINRVIGDIDEKLRFKLQRYFENHHLLIEARFGLNEAGANWAKYLEYGTNDDRIIALQNFGVTRHLANYLLKFFSEAFIIEGTNLIDIDKKLLIEKFDKNVDEYAEYQNSYLAI
jgi:superfamily II DNA/RNA helicase